MCSFYLDAGPAYANETTASKIKLAALDVAVWQPASEGRAPLIVFSHGFGGSNTQSTFLMEALAKDGYIIFAPNHHDAHGLMRGMQPQVPFHKAQLWSATTHEDRRKDIVNLLDALKSDPIWAAKIDWDNIGLCGHSLGGYTVLGLAGAWPQWKLAGVKAVLALSPFAAPYVVSKSLGNINVPVMYQGGSKDVFLTPLMLKENGVYDQTPAPAYLVDFDGAGHLAWTGFNHNDKQKEQIDFYSLKFFDWYLKAPQIKNIGSVDDLEKRDGVVEVRSK